MRCTNVLWVLLLCSVTALATPVGRPELVTFDSLSGNGTFQDDYHGFGFSGDYTNNPAGIVSCCEAAESIFSASLNLQTFGMNLDIPRNGITWVSAYFTALGGAPEELDIYVEPIFGTNAIIGTTPTLVSFANIPGNPDGLFFTAKDPFEIDNISYFRSYSNPEPASLFLLLGGGLLIATKKSRLLPTNESREPYQQKGT